LQAGAIADNLVNMGHAVQSSKFNIGPTPAALRCRNDQNAQSSSKYANSHFDGLIKMRDQLIKMCIWLAGHYRALSTGGRFAWAG
jgi:hypothetical protein